jgi:hypothetical protein
MTLFKALILLLVPALAYPQTYYEDFIYSLLHDKDNLRKFADDSELARSERLGISYDDVKNKFLISYDIDDDIRSKIREGKNTYRTYEHVQNNEFSRIEFTVPSLNYSKSFYFYKSKFIPPTRFFTREWQTRESKYFVFKISNPLYFNDYCVKKLDDFVDSICTLLDVNTLRKQTLQKEKIYYVFCNDESEVESLTGFKTKGMFVTAFDEVITSYNTHYHEVAHVLINFKLQKLGLYTLPFFLEGFAVAVGGRGGMSSRVVTDVGYYIQKISFLTYDSILTNNTFYEYDANMTYALSGMYNLFLLNELSPKKYLELYKKTNGSLEFVRNKAIEPGLLPNKASYDEFVRKYETSRDVFIDENDTNKSSVRIPGAGMSILKINDYYKFFTSNTFIFSPAERDFTTGDYESKMYHTFFKKGKSIPDKFPGMKYGILADSVSVKLYNFYADELIATYEKNFSIESKNVAVIDGYFVFFINRNVFGTDLQEAVSILGSR